MTTPGAQRVGADAVEKSGPLILTVAPRPDRGFPPKQYRRNGGLTSRPQGGYAAGVESA
jgi:hypothetical protein